MCRYTSLMRQQQSSSGSMASLSQSTPAMNNDYPVLYAGILHWCGSSSRRQAAWHHYPSQLQQWTRPTWCGLSWRMPRVVYNSAKYVAFCSSCSCVFCLVEGRHAKALQRFPSLALLFIMLLSDRFIHFLMIMIIKYQFLRCCNMESNSRAPTFEGWLSVNSQLI